MKHIEDTWPDKFNDEVLILRLSITIDVLNPFSQPNTTHTIWLVVEINNSIPPWFIVKNEHLMLALIVPPRTSEEYGCLPITIVDELKEI